MTLKNLLSEVAVSLNRQGLFCRNRKEGAEGYDWDGPPFTLSKTHILKLWDNNGQFGSTINVKDILIASFSL